MVHEGSVQHEKTKFSIMKQSQDCACTHAILLADVFGMSNVALEFGLLLEVWCFSRYLMSLVQVEF